MVAPPPLRPQPCVAPTPAVTPPLWCPYPCGAPTPVVPPPLWCPHPCGAPAPAPSCYWVFTSLCLPNSVQQHSILTLSLNSNYQLIIVCFTVCNNTKDRTADNTRHAHNDI